MLLLLATGTTDRKVRRSTGVTTANSTNKYQKYKSVELGDQLVFSPNSNSTNLNCCISLHPRLIESLVAKRYSFYIRAIISKNVRN